MKLLFTPVIHQDFLKSLSINCRTVMSLLDKRYDFLLKKCLITLNISAFILKNSFIFKKIYNDLKYLSNRLI